MHPSKILAACGALLLSLHAQAASLAGTYLLQSERGAVVAKLEVQASVLTGTLEIPGAETIRLAGAAKGPYGHGLALSGAGMGAFEATVQGDDLRLSISESDGDDGTKHYPLTLRRAGTSGETVAARATGRPASSSKGGGGSAGDERLVGTWIHQTMISSGDASFASEKYFAFRPDGTYSYGNGASAGGGSSWGYDGGSGEETEAGAWRTDGNQIDYKPNGADWQRLGRFTFYNGSLVIYYANGGHWIWGRR